MFVSLTLIEDNNGWLEGKKQQWGHFERSLICRQSGVCVMTMQLHMTLGPSEKKNAKCAMHYISAISVLFLFYFVFEMEKKVF